MTVCSFGSPSVLGFLIDKTLGFRVTAEAEVEGIDLAEHAEAGTTSPSGGGGGGGAFALAGITPVGRTAAPVSVGSPDRDVSVRARSPVSVGRWRDWP